MFLFILFILSVILIVTANHYKILGIRRSNDAKEIKKAYKFICIYIYIQLLMFIWLNMYLHIHTSIYTYICLYLFMSRHRYIFMYSWVDIDTHIFTYAQIHGYCKYMYTYVHYKFDALKKNNSLWGYRFLYICVHGNDLLCYTRYVYLWYPSGPPGNLYIWTIFTWW